MRKKTIFYVLFFAAILLSGICKKSYANPVDEQQARTVAQNFLRNVSKEPIGELSNITNQTPWTEFYIFSFESGSSQRSTRNSGFIIVSADDCVIPILGYSLTNRFETTDIPPQISSWLQDYEMQIAWWREQAGSNGIPASDPNAPLQNWSRLVENNTTPRQERSGVGPLLTTEWGQGEYYNLLCPVDESDDLHVPTGCVATAVAQIMKKWNFPVSGYGSHYYDHPTFGHRDADFGNTIYDWNNMPDSLTDSSTLTEVAAIAILLAHIGVAVEMNYGSNGSSATIYHDYNFSNSSAEVALRTYFKYKSSLHQITYNDYSDSEWKSMLKNELNISRPILYRGKNDDFPGSHAFVCDGYTSNSNLFHMNWGWNGRNNGDYAIGSLNPHDTLHFNTNNVAIIGIEPNDNWGTSTTVTATSNNSSFGTVTGGGTYAFGGNVTVMAQAASGMRFDGWTDGYKYNPRQFVANGGNLNFTARFRSIAGDTLTYCIGNSSTFGYGNANTSNTKYWGVKFPATSQTPGHKLRKVQLFVTKAGNYTLRVYYGSINSSGLKRTQSFTVTNEELNAWKTITLDTPYDITGTAMLYITFSSASAYPAIASYYSGNNDGLLYGNSYNQLNIGDIYGSWMIRAITSADICNTITTFPYTEDFEGDFTCWNFVNGNFSNRWVIGTAANVGSGGNHSMYISNDNGISNAYSPDIETPGVMAYKTLQLEPRDYCISYKWEAYGQTDCDYLRVALVPASIELTAGTSWGHGDLPEGYIPLDGNSQLTQIFPFATHTDTVTISTAGYYNLVFYWTNDGNIGNNMTTAATIDNISIDITSRQIATVPYHEDFEGDVSNWFFINGNYNNQWHVGTAINNTTDGSHALYISNDGGDSYAYSNSGATSMVMAYRTLHLEEHYYTISFDWKGYGQASYDYLRAALVPESVDLSTATSWGTGTLPEGYISLDNNNILYAHNNWTTRTATVGIPAAGNYRLVFYWCNNNSSGSQPPAAIDNITVRYPIEIQDEIVSYCGNRTRSNYLGGGGEAYWGISFTPLELADFNYLKSVLLYTVDAGTYAMTIYNGDDTHPVTPIYSQSYNVSSEDGYKRLDLDVPVAISHTDHLWVTFYNNDISYPANTCIYMGDPHSNWVSEDEGASWIPLNEAYSSLQYSWMIMIVTSESANEVVCDTIRSFPYADNFEENSSCWSFANGNCLNQWAIGSAANNTMGGSHALYVSNDCGFSNTYQSYGQTSIVKAYRTFQLEEQSYLVSFDWKSGGHFNYDYLRVALVPESVNVNSITSLGTNSLPEGYIPLDDNKSLSNHSSWTRYTTLVDIPSAGYYNLVFYWQNVNYYGDNPPAAIDNLLIENLPYVDNVTTPIHEDFETNDANNKWLFINGNYINQWAIGSAVNNTPDGSNALYVSNDGGITNAYTNQNAASYVKVFRPFRFEALNYTISFDWKCLGNANSNGGYVAFMRVALVPENCLLTGTTWDHNTIPSNCIVLDEGLPFAQSTSWSTYTTNFSIPKDGVYCLVFYWENRNSNNNYNPPAAIDNITITPLYPVSTYPYIEDFEDPTTFTNWTLQQSWSIGSATNNTPDGSHALYISGDGGVSNSYGNSAVGTKAFRTFRFEAGNYLFHFDWKGVGSQYSGYMRAVLVPASVDLTSNTSWENGTLPSGSIVLDGNVNLNQQSTWTTKTTFVSFSTAGDYNLVFFWKNGGSCGYPAAVDNIMIDTAISSPYAINSLFVENFENSSNDIYWSVINANTTTDYLCGPPPQQWAIGSATNNTPDGSRALYISDDNGSSNSYWTSISAPRAIAYRTLQFEARTYTISFDWKCNGESGYDFLRVALVPNSYDLSQLYYSYNGYFSEFIELDNHYQMVQQSEWTTRTETFTVATPGEYKLVFFWRNDSNDGNNPPAAIDNIVIMPRSVIHEGDTISYCGSDPIQNTVGMGDTSSDFYWGIRIPAAHLAECNSIEEVLIYIDGNQPGNYTLRLHQGDQTTPQNLLYSHIYSFTSNLNQYKSCTLPHAINIDNTQDLWVSFYSMGISYPAAGCLFAGDTNSDLLSNDGISWRHAYANHDLPYTWLIKVVTSGDTYTFLCDTITNFPHTFDFENPMSLECWTTFDGDGDGENWFLAGFSPSANGGSMCIASSSPNSFSGAPVPDNWIVSPVIQLPVDSNIRLSWFERISRPNFPGEDIGVYISDGSPYISDFNLLQQYTVTAGDWTQHNLFLDAYAGQTVRLAFRHFNTTSQNSLIIDDINMAFYTPPAITINGNSSVKVGTSAYYTATVDQEADVTWYTEGTFPTDTHIGPNISVVWFNVGTYNVVATATNVNGSTSDTLVVTVRECENVFTNQEVTTCNSYTWIDGNTYTASTTEPTYTLTNAEGCDSILMLHLTINYDVTSEFTIATSDSCYEWNGFVYCNSGDYTQTLTASTGCDSVVTLHLTTSVGIENHDVVGTIYLAPNPAQDISRIYGVGKSLKSVDVIDIQGRLMMRVYDNEINVSMLPSGVYLVKVVTDKGVTNLKLVK